MVFVINHRSNMDYILVTYLVAERSALSYAVGEWARVWPLKQLVRAMGGTSFAVNLAISFIEECWPDTCN